MGLLIGPDLMGLIHCLTALMLLFILHRTDLRMSLSDWARFGGVDSLLDTSDVAFYSASDGFHDESQALLGRSNSACLFVLEGGGSRSSAVNFWHYELACIDRKPLYMDSLRVMS